MKVRVKKLHPKSVTPRCSKPGDAGLDLTAVSREKDEYGNIIYGTGLAFEIPEGHVGLLFPRSSNSKKDLILTNHVGVVDSSYRGEVMMKYKPFVNAGKVRQGHLHYSVGERIGQMIIMPYPKIEMEEAEELTQTERNDGGFGSTGK